MKRIKIGDIFKINTSKGDVYLQYVYKDPSMGSLIKIFDNVEQKNSYHTKEKFLVFFPLSYAYKKGIVQFVDYNKIENFEKPKFMRTKHFVRGEFLGWHIIDTNTWNRKLVHNLTSEQKKMSPWGIWNDTLLKENLENNWSLENW